MEDVRIGLFIDYENLAIGARDDLKIEFDFAPITDALAERGRVVVRRAYADWSRFETDRQMLTMNHVELIEIPQRKGMVRKNAADIKMAVDAIELAFERDYITTFVICTGDSDFSPLVQKLRELNKSVIGVGLKASTSRLLPPACDEFLFYENLDGVDIPQARVIRRGTDEPAHPSTDLASLDSLVSRTLSGLLRSEGNFVRSSHLKRALLRKDSTFAEGDYGFRSFGELIRNLAERGVVEIDTTVHDGDPTVAFPATGRGEDKAFALLADTVDNLASGEPVPLSGLKDEMRKVDESFSEKTYGYSGFLQFVKAAKAQGVVSLDFDAESGAYAVSVLEGDS
ncbi:MAG: NYN domain-containing protein [Armatimonadetes bacterium]|nr:MAG: NYN domain-containing protein [Armatimonadota bacterium]